MAEQLDLDEQIGGGIVYVLKGLERWLEHGDSLTVGQFEVVRDIVEHPEDHRRDISTIYEEELTYRELKERFDASSPKHWGFPADTWETADRIHELRSRTELDDRAATVQALTEHGRGRDEIAAMLNASKSDIGRVRQRIA